MELSNTPSKLMLKTQEMLSIDQRTPLDIHKQSGLPYYWLKEFKSGRIVNPSVNRVEKLYTFLAGKDLVV